MELILIDLGTVASTRESRVSNPQNLAISPCSSGVKELWRRAKVSLGFKASTEMDRLCWGTETAPKIPFFLKNMGDEEAMIETYLDDDHEKEPLGADSYIFPLFLGLECLASETNRLNNALLASLLARSIDEFFFSCQKTQMGMFFLPN